MLCRFLLTINGVIHQLDKNCVKNWDEISNSIKRVGYDGVIRTFSSGFQFTDIAYDLVYNEYLNNYLHAVASVSIYVADELHSLKNEFTARLDFGTLKCEHGILSVNTFDDSITSLINAKKNITYEYPVAEVKDDIPLLYDGMMMEESVRWSVVSNVSSEPLYGETNIPVELFGDRSVLPLYVSGEDVAVKGAVEYEDQGVYSNYQYIAKAYKKSVVSLEVNIDVMIYMKSYHPSGGVVQGWLHIDGLTIYIIKKRKDGTEELADSFFWETVSKEPVKKSTNEKYAIELDEGDCIIIKTMLVQSDVETHNIDIVYEFLDTTYIKAVWNNRIQPVTVQVVKPLSLLNRILRSINGERDGMDGEIVYGIDDRLDNALIIPAESIRGIGDAKIYTSYNDFVNWISIMFGYVPVIDDRIVRFVHRDSLYSNKEPVEIGDAINDFSFSVNESLIYSTLRVGFDKKDYDSVNGRDEFRWTSEFSTGINITDKKKEMISPYRADAYGIEFLAEKRGKDTTDDESDSDIFFVCARLDFTGGKYELARGGEYVVTGVLSPDSMFNVMYSPRSIIMANRRFLGISIDHLVFASSEGNSDVAINGIKETEDVVITADERLFTAGEVSFISANGSSFDVDAPVAIRNSGREYIGYMAEKSYKYGRYEGVKYKLFVKTIE